MLQIQQLAQASEFYVPNGYHDRVALTTNGRPDIRGWSDWELVNTKPGWESLGIASSCLLSGDWKPGNWEWTARLCCGIAVHSSWGL